ncbi:MAG: YitT family protein [Clostridia bacterium]|nr:YitT family protein [Clostridia bacterium]
MNLINKISLREEVKNTLYILTGLIVCALAYRMFLVPNDVAAGGFTGIGQLVNALIGIKVGTVALILNVPLFMLSMRSLGLKFGLRSFISSMLLSLFIDYLPISAATDNVLLATIFGGVIGGAGFGLILRGNATTGGSDMLATLVHSRLPSMKVGVLIFIIDAAVIVASAFVFSPEQALYALISVGIMNYTLEYVLEGANRATAYIIVSKESEVIARRVMDELERGVTALNGKGMYSGEDRQVLLCVVSRIENMQLRRIVAACDPRAFMITVSASEVLGEGFKDIKPASK